MNENQIIHSPYRAAVLVLIEKAYNDQIPSEKRQQYFEGFPVFLFSKLEYNNPPFVPLAEVGQF